MAYVGSAPAELFGTLDPNSIRTIDIKDDAITAAKIAAGAIAYADVTGTPTLATVATTGAYSDVTGTPTLPTFPSGVVAGTTDTQTLTNKTIIDPIVTLNATQGEAGQYPVSQGTGLSPVWTTPESGFSYATLLKFQ